MFHMLGCARRGVSLVVDGGGVRGGALNHARMRPALRLDLLLTVMPTGTSPLTVIGTHSLLRSYERREGDVCGELDGTALSGSQMTVSRSAAEQQQAVAVHSP